MAYAGLASEQATKQFASGFDASENRYHRHVGLAWSSVGVGTYLGSADTETDDLVSAAITASVRRGVNVIDTAANYRRGHGERAVGAALKELLKDGKVRRNQLIVCTKAGYLPTSAKQFLEEYEGVNGIGQDDLVAENHCLHPAYIEDRIKKSCDAMGVAALDVFYLHNPEAQLAHVSREKFDARLTAAFEVLEGAVRSGRIGCYGLATWRAFRASPGEKGYVSLAGIKALSQKAAGRTQTGLKCVQMPLAISMPEAVSRPTQWVGDATVPAIAAARLLGMAVVTSGSIAKAKFPEMNKNLLSWLGANFATDAQRALQFTRSASGVTTALVGMKAPAHVDQNLEVFEKPPLPRAGFELMFRTNPV